MFDQEARELCSNDSIHRLLFTSNDSSSTAPLDQPSQNMNFSDNYLHGYANDEEEEEEEANVSKKFKQSKLDGDHGGKISEKISRPKKRVEKKEKGPRFAFVTKSETDHLEDGYRWRKYGQKALKNSPYPRGYYRCTTQNCGVKKRVQRSFEDPSVVITTYEGSHTHHLPGTLRGNATISGPSFQNPMNYRIRNYEDIGGTTRSNDIMYYHDQLPNNLTPLHHLQF